jgi:hypothetical protein
MDVQHRAFEDVLQQIVGIERRATQSHRQPAQERSVCSEQLVDLPATQGIIKRPDGNLPAIFPWRLWLQHDPILLGNICALVRECRGASTENALLHRKEPPMIRAIAFALLLTGVAACASTLDTAASQSPFCEAVMPPLTPWDGNGVPLTTDMTGIHICDSPKDAGHIWAFVVDGDQVTAKIDIKPEQIAQFLQRVFGYAQAAATGTQGHLLSNKPLYVENIVCKGDMGTRPSARMSGAGFASVDPDNAPYLIYRTHVLYDAINRAADDIASGKVCTGK